MCVCECIYLFPPRHPRQRCLPFDLLSSSGKVGEALLSPSRIRRRRRRRPLARWSRRWFVELCMVFGSSACIK